MSNEARRLATRVEDKAQAVATKAAPRLTSFALAHPLVTLVLCCLIFYLAITFGAGLVAGVREAFENRAVEKLERQADKHLEVAGAADRARTAEDQKRETNIRPRIDTTTKDLAAARARRRQAETNYEKSQANSIPNLDAHDLHERNCADLRQLYAGEPIPHCDR